MASFEKLSQLKDLRGKTKSKGAYTDHGVNSKTDIAIHHSLTKSGDSAAFANYHVGTHGWPGVAYHFVILKNGTIEWNHNLGIKSYHVGNSNKIAVGICLVGDFRSEEPTDTQKASLYALHECLKRDLPNYKRTRGHNEFPGYAWKACPVFDYKAVINGGGKSVTVPAAKPKVKTEVVTAPKPTASKPKQTGDATIRSIQSTLNSRYKAGLSVDGIYGPNTKKALIKGYQTELNRQYGAKLAVDGVWGTKTKSATRTVRKGASGNITYILQAVLYCLGHNPKGVDGKFGANTESAVKSFQKAKGLAVDGIAGKNTFEGAFK